MWRGMDRRGFPRVDFPCRVTVFVKGKEEKFSTHTENIGTGGICVAINKKLERFLPVDLVLYLEDNQPPIECEARIVWVVKRQNEFDTGIEFANIKEEDVSRLERIMSECLKDNQNDTSTPSRRLPRT
jgi:c-di-GMP-binding flagellar brake protein YcgR